MFYVFIIIGVLVLLELQEQLDLAPKYGAIQLVTVKLGSLFCYIVFKRHNCVKEVTHCVNYVQVRITLALINVHLLN